MNILSASQSIWFLEQVFSDLGFSEWEISGYRDRACCVPKNRLVSAHINSGLGICEDLKIICKHLDQMIRLFGHKGLDNQLGSDITYCPGCKSFDESQRGITLVFLNVTPKPCSGSILSKTQQNKGLLPGLEVALMLLSQPILLKRLCEYDCDIRSMVAPGLVSETGLPVEIRGYKDRLCINSFCKVQRVASIVTCDGIG